MVQDWRKLMTLLPCAQRMHAHYPLRLLKSERACAWLFAPDLVIHCASDSKQKPKRNPDTKSAKFLPYIRLLYLEARVLRAREV